MTKCGTQEKQLFLSYLIYIRNIDKFGCFSCVPLIDLDQFSDTAILNRIAALFLFK